MDFDPTRRRLLHRTATVFALAPFAASASDLVSPSRATPSPHVPEPPEGFGPDTTAADVVRGLDLRGHTLLVSGRARGHRRRRRVRDPRANGLFSAELARREIGHGITSVCVTPGHTRTDILRHVGDGYRDDARDVAHGAATPAYAAAHPAMERVTGGLSRRFPRGGGVAESARRSDGAPPLGCLRPTDEPLAASRRD